MVSIIMDNHGSILGDNYMSNEDNENIRNHLHKYVYVYDIVDVPNNIIVGINNGGRRTGRLMTFNDGTIRWAQNNHCIVGQRVEIGDII